MADIKYGMLDRREADVFQGYLLPEVYARRMEPSVFFYGATVEDEIIAVASFEIGAVENELLSVAVSPAWQGKGVGSELVDQIIELLVENGANGFTAYLSGNAEELDGLDQFLWRCGFELEDDEPVGQFTLADAQEADMLQRVMQVRRPAAVQPLSSVTSVESRRFANQLVSKDLYYGWQSPAILQDVSAVYMEEDKIVGCVLIGDRAEEGLVLEFAYVEKSCKDQLALLHLIAFSLEKLVERYPLETPISTITVNTIAESILERILGAHVTPGVVRRYVLNLA